MLQDLTDIKRKIYISKIKKHILKISIIDPSAGIFA